ncbi:SDR family NAD(P)-dependent oxidoreductase [Rhizobium leguminosarum]|uniref:SDR family NAD(P)-dependent oxidoreductase n=1 Tax=Rhizobium leguminosarum TaxID=384 RepID=UPI001FDF7BBE|nr:SDR family NAD(P)-dependent oxidoreductase [Rhizobium leguminosarum]
MGADVLIVPTDVTDADQVRALVEAGLSFGVIAVWVSKVGVGAVGKFQDTPIEAHEQVIRANLIRHMNDAHAVLPIFTKQDQGIFINIISHGRFAAAPYATAYSASKVGLKGFSEALRGQYHPNILIRDIYPAFIDAPGVSHVANYTGRELSAPPPVYDARKVADAVVGVSRDPKATTTVGATDTLRTFLCSELERTVHELVHDDLVQASRFNTRHRWQSLYSFVAARRGRWRIAIWQTARGAGCGGCHRSHISRSLRHGKQIQPHEASQ